LPLPCALASDSRSCGRQNRSMNRTRRASSPSGRSRTTTRWPNAAGNAGPAPSCRSRCHPARSTGRNRGGGAGCRVRSPHSTCRRSWSGSRHPAAGWPRSPRVASASPGNPACPRCARCGMVSRRLPTPLRWLSTPVSNIERVGSAGGRDMEVREAGAGARQRVQVGCGDLAAVRAHVGEAPVVGDQHHDVRSCVSRRPAHGAQRTGATSGTRRSFSDHAAALTVFFSRVEQGVVSIGVTSTGAGGTASGRRPAASSAAGRTAASAPHWWQAGHGVAVAHGLNISASSGHVDHQQYHRRNESASCLRESRIRQPARPGVPVQGHRRHQAGGFEQCRFIVAQLEWKFGLRM
jgi:hypothetical protein